MCAMVQNGIDNNIGENNAQTPCRVKYVKPEIEEILLELEGPAFLALTSLEKEPDSTKQVPVNDDEFAEEFD